METNTNNQYRNHMLHDITEANVDQTLRVCGWVENIRDHGGVSFIDLRDMYGELQVVIRDGALLEGISREDCISVEGLIEHRDEETYNPKIPTGTIELDAKQIDVLGKVYTQLPFEIMTSKEIREDLRLKYRYLDPFFSPLDHEFSLGHRGCLISFSFPQASYYRRTWHSGRCSVNV